MNTSNNSPAPHRRKGLRNAFLSRSAAQIALAGVAAAACLHTAQAAPAERAVAVLATVGYPAHSPITELPASALDQNKTLLIVLSLKVDHAAIHEFTRELYDPKSPTYHKWLTPDEFGRRFGASDSDIAAVEKWAEANGLHVTGVPKGRGMIMARTTVAGARKAFSTTIGVFRRGGSKASSEILFAPKTSLLLPESIASKVESVSGMSNAARQVPLARRFAKPNPFDDTSTLKPLSPSQLATFYDLVPLQTQTNYGSGEEIGIYEPAQYDPDDLAAFEAAYDITAPYPPISEYPASAQPATNLDDDFLAEADLDVETITGLAPNAQIVIYDGDDLSDADIIAQYQQMADDALPVISYSYGFPEDELADFPDLLPGINPSIEQLASEGSTLLASSGDTGAYGDADGTTLGDPTVSAPASSDFATGVGGTEITAFGTGNSYGTETGWGDDTFFGSAAASGGGLSTIYDLPSWQTGLGVNNSSSNGMRQVPDIAALAGPPGANIYIDDEAGPVGGTSLAAPIWAAASLLVGEALGQQKLGLFAATLYPLANSSTTTYASAFHDITTGSDLYSGGTVVYDCTADWDYVTGLGSADFAQLYTALAAQASSTTGSSAHTFAAGLQMISAPYDYSDASLSTLFGTAPTLFYYDPATNSYDKSPTEPADTLRPGYGYWVKFSASTSLLATPTAKSRTSISVPLVAGWNMVGVPSTSNVAVNAVEYKTSAGSTVSLPVAISDGYVGEHFYTFSSGSSAYTVIGSADSLTPYSGYWLFADQPGTLIIP